MTPETIKAYRQAHGLSTRALGKICGVSHRTVEDWEQGRRSPNRSAQMLLLRHATENTSDSLDTLDLDNKLKHWIDTGEWND